MIRIGILVLPVVQMKQFVIKRRGFVIDGGEYKTCQGDGVVDTLSSVSTTPSDRVKKQS